MYAYIQGKLVHSDPSFVLIDVNGVGYSIRISVGCFSNLPQIGGQLQLYTSFIVRENSQTLYGFISPKERDVFEVLMNVSGIGPKLALSLVGHMTLTDLQSAVSRSDFRVISRVPGIGKKTAERLVVEMRDKLPNMFSKTPSDYAISVPSDPRSQTAQDIAGALVNLGYKQVKAQQAAQKTLEDFSETEDLSILIRESLKLIS
ncbi:MAG: Holliday junction ATP-dependent DNA helicase RuvA [Chlamydiae bacterium]|nr:Holliday junction ATP-dependent DNA helicase RuvA [Chlamydiota bacterium]